MIIETNLFIDTIQIGITKGIGINALVFKTNQGLRAFYILKALRNNTLILEAEIGSDIGAIKVAFTTIWITNPLLTKLSNTTIIIGKTKLV